MGPEGDEGVGGGGGCGGVLILRKATIKVKNTGGGRGREGGEGRGVFSRRKGLGTLMKRQICTIHKIGGPC